MNRIAKQSGETPDRGAAVERREAGYDVWLAGEIAAGCAELDAGEGLAAETVWAELGLD